MPEKWLTSGEAAKMLEVSERTMSNWRASGKGPAYAKLGFSVRYREEDILAWVEANIVQPRKPKEQDAA